MRTCKLLAAVFFIFFTFNVAHACSCGPNGPPCNYAGSTGAIFLGRVVGSTERKTYVDNQGNKIVLDTGKVRFLVQENFKGVSGYEVEVYSGGPCGVSFIRNESYVVYAHRIKEDNILITSMCSRTRHITGATEDLEYFRGLANAKPGGTIYGKLKRMIGDTHHGPSEEGPKMAGVKITVTGEGKTIETTTNDAGEFRLTGLTPGDYDAVPQLPDNLAAVSNRDTDDNFGRFTGRRPIRLADRGCGEIDFVVQFSGVISGKVVEVDGQPANKVQVNLLSEADGDKDWSTWTDKDGNYEFRMVQPGSYLLGFNLRWAPEKDDPYPKNFYPGVKTRSEAALVTVGEGEKLKGYDMTLPPQLQAQPLRVTVVWPDGSPAVGVTVVYEMNEATSNGERIETDRSGSAIIDLFQNYYYVIYADAERNGKDFYSTPVEVFADKKLKPLKFVLNKKGYGFEAAEALKRESPN
jgi:hypothetical protein